MNLSEKSRREKNKINDMEIKFNKKLMMPLMLLIGWQTMSAQMIYHDGNNYNQIASEEFKQWDFSPKEYYYSWYKKKVVFWHVTVPGLGVHDKGFAGTHVPKGDNYVNERWRQMTPLRAASVATNAMNEEKVEEISKKWEEMAKQAALEEADALVDAAYSITSSERNRLKRKITENILHNEMKTMTNLTLEYERILSNIKYIKDSRLGNAERLEAYQAENKRLKELSIISEKCAMINGLSNYIKKNKTK
jgi:hypothetical protein